MKRVSILFVSVMAALVSFAQPQAGSFGVEVGFAPFNDGPVFDVDGLKVRYFLSDNMAVRGTLSFEMDSKTDGVYNPADNKLVNTEKTTTTVFGITPGFEYHAAQFGKASVYVGAEVGVAFGNGKYSNKYEDSTVSPDSEGKGSVFGFEIGAFTGIDYYITSNLYIGAELGLGFNTLKTTPAQTSTSGSTTVNNDTYEKITNFGFQAVPSFRLGWTF